MKMMHPLLPLILALCLSPCCDRKPDSEPVEEPGFLTVASGGRSSFSVRIQMNLQSSAAPFVQDIRKATGVTLETVPVQSQAKTDGHEIVIGSVTAYQDLVSAALKELRHGFLIKAEGSKILIAGTDDAWTVLGMEHFTGRMLTSPAFCTGGVFKVPEDYSYKQDKEDPQLIAELVTKGRKFDLVPVEIGTCPREGIFTVAQGAASDEKYVYFTMKGKEDGTTHDSQVRIHQYTLSPFKAVGVSATFNGHHANDMAYDSKGNRILVVHGSGGSDCLTAIPAGPGMGDPVLIKTSLGIGGLTYNARRDIYGITQGGSKYQTADASFKLIKNYGRSDNMKDTYTAQGMGSDDSYVYFPMSPGSASPEKVNLLVTYDWDGKYIGNLKIPLTLESESMFYAGGEYYVSFYNKGATLYRVYPNLSYQAQIR